MSDIHDIQWLWVVFGTLAVGAIVNELRRIVTAIDLLAEGINKRLAEIQQSIEPD
jgi:hypothetical protein